ncbi:MAG: hypothetical protein ABSF43_08790 [Rectinemataceae bacterium]
MEDPQAFSRQLEERLDARREKLNGVELPRLKDSFKNFQTAFVGMSVILRKKGVLHDDPYRFDLKISDVTIPSESHFSDAEKVDQISIRVSQLEAYLEFLDNYYEFSCDFLTLGRIKRLLALVMYFNFTQFSEISAKLNTRALCEIASMVKKGSDQLSAGLIADSILRLEKASRDIIIRIKDLTEYYKERYKLELRRNVMSGLSMDVGLAIGRREEAIKLIKRKFAEVATGRPFYPELVDEVLLEDFSSDGPALREERLRRFAAAEENKAGEAKAKSFKSMILDGIRSISAASFALEEAISKLEEDSVLLSSLDKGLGARLGRAFRKVFPSKKKGLVYELHFVDPVTRGCTKETLDFGVFVDEMCNKARSLSSLAQRGGASAKQLEGMSDAQAYDFLQRNIEELQRALRVLAALEDYFKSESPEEARTRVRGVRGEITTIKGAVIKANQKKHEYVAQREELEQMKRLGIKDSAS